MKMSLTIAGPSKLHAVRSLLLIFAVALGVGGLSLMIAPGLVLLAFHVPTGLSGSDFLFFFTSAAGPVAISFAYLCAILRSLNDWELVALFGAPSGSEPKSR